jgi:hypothetical protein
MRHWPETATAVALRLREDDAVELAAPFDVDDLLVMVLRPTPHFRAHRLDAYRKRQRAKSWHTRWPRLREL